MGMYMYLPILCIFPLVWPRLEVEQTALARTLSPPAHNPHTHTHHTHACIRTRDMLYEGLRTRVV